MRSIKRRVIKKKTRRRLSVSGKARRAKASVSSKASSRSTRYRRLKRGGNPQSSGTYGCVFYKPALRCANEPKRQDGISKLMLKRNMLEEIQEINSVKSVVSKIQNNEKYFLVQTTSQCTPGPLDKTEDLPGFDSICYNLNKRGFTAQNINSKLNELAIINIPYGGKDMDDFWEEFSLIESQAERNAVFIKTNKALIDLLFNGIQPLFKNGMIHNDVKAGNVLMDKNYNARLIDWGLAFPFTAKNQALKRVPEKIKNYKSLIYNWPVSQLLFGQTDFMLSGSSSAIARNIVNDAVTKKGHISHMTKLLTAVGVKAKVPADDDLRNAIAVLEEYLVAVLNKYKPSTRAPFDKYAFFTEVYAPNADLYGFLTIYEFFVLKNNVSLMPPLLVSRIKSMLNRYCISTEYATKQYNWQEIKQDLEALNECCEALPESGNRPALRESLNTFKMNPLNRQPMTTNMQPNTTNMQPVVTNMQPVMTNMQL